MEKQEMNENETLTNEMKGRGFPSKWGTVL